ncbi:MAG: mandelate racemase/muconate lactonizing enzyme family protein [Devosia sp.]
MSYYPFQFARDRVIGDSQVRTDIVNVTTLELVTDDGTIGLDFIQTLFQLLAFQAETERVFANEVWQGLVGQPPMGFVHRVYRPRGGNQRAYSLPFHEALQFALWVLAAKQAGLPLHLMLGSGRNKVRAYASGLNFHPSDSEFEALFPYADQIGYRAFKIKLGHPDFDRDLGRLRLLAKTVRPGAQIMSDANEAWGAKEAAVKLAAIKTVGFELLWVEDPILRNDLEGLRDLRSNAPWTLVNSGEYLDAADKRQLLLARGTDILNVHGQVSDVMHVGWLAAELGIPVTLGSTFLEVGVHMVCALPEVEWLEYSSQNFDHLVEQPIEISDGWITAPDRPGHGPVLSESARREWARPDVLPGNSLGAAPVNLRSGPNLF